MFQILKNLQRLRGNAPQTPQRGVAPAPDQGPTGPWTPVQDFQFSNVRPMLMSAKLKWKRFKTDHNEKTLIQISREYRGLLKKTERTARKKYHLKLKTLRHNNPTEYWKEIKDKRNADCPINIEDLYDHFKNLFFLLRSPCAEEDTRM